MRTLNISLDERGAEFGKLGGAEEDRMAVVIPRRRLKGDREIVVIQGRARLPNGIESIAKFLVLLNRAGHQAIYGLLGRSLTK